MESLLAGCYGFHCFERFGCIVIIMAQSIPSIPIPRKVFVKYWHLLWLLTSEQEQTKLLKLLSLPKPINSNHFCEIYLQSLEEITPFLGKNNLLPNWKVSLCCFEELKMLCNLSHSPVLFHDPYLGDLNNSYKNRSPLCKKKLTYPQVIWYCSQTQALVFLHCSQEMATHIQTTFVSQFKLITATVPFSGTVLQQISLSHAVQS